MPEKTEKLKDLLRSWAACGEKVRDAIVVRDFETCQRADSEARRLFGSMVAIIDSEEGLESISELTTEVLGIVELWRRNVESMPDWLKETGREIESVRTRLSTRRKLGGAYDIASATGRRSGIRLKVKAR